MYEKFRSLNIKILLAFIPYHNKANVEVHFCKECVFYTYRYKNISAVRRITVFKNLYIFIIGQYMYKYVCRLLNLVYWYAYHLIKFDPV